MERISKPGNIEGVSAACRFEQDTWNWLVEAGYEDIGYESGKEEVTRKLAKRLVDKGLVRFTKVFNEDLNCMELVGYLEVNRLEDNENAGTC